jgi:hypothetical protein
MPIDYSRFREVAERAKAHGLIAHVITATKKKCLTPERQTRKRRRPSNPTRSNYDEAIFKIACPACGSAKGERCKPTIGLTEDIPVHASRIYEAERN